MKNDLDQRISDILIYRERRLKPRLKTLRLSAVRFKKVVDELYWPYATYRPSIPVSAFPEQLLFHYWDGYIKLVVD